MSCKRFVVPGPPGPPGDPGPQGARGPIGPRGRKIVDMAVYATPGSNTFQVPQDVDYILVEMWGGGGGGGGSRGGGSGAYIRTVLPVSAGQVWNIYVGAGNNTSNNGESTTFSYGTITLTAGGGLSNGTGGTATANGLTSGYVTIDGGSTSDAIGADAPMGGSGGRAGSIARPGQQPGGGGYLFSFGGDGLVIVTY